MKVYNYIFLVGNPVETKTIRISEISCTIGEGSCYLYKRVGRGKKYFTAIWFINMMNAYYSIGKGDLVLEFSSLKKLSDKEIKRIDKILNDGLLAEIFEDFYLRDI